MPAQGISGIRLAGCPFPFWQVLSASGGCDLTVRGLGDLRPDAYGAIRPLTRQLPDNQLQK